MIYLASKSPRRRKLLSKINLSYKAVEPDVSEDIKESVTPEEHVEILALRKAAAAASRLNDDDMVIGADTVVVFDRMIIEKPTDKSDAFKMLTMLAGSWHDVYTGVAVVQGRKTLVKSEKTRVKFNDLTTEEIEDYIATGEPFDKSGAYGIQEKGAMLVERIEGDYFNVVGLPLSLLRKMMLAFEIDPLK